MDVKPKDAVSREWFERAIQARRDYAPAINNLASSYTQAGQQGDAIAALRYGIQVAPDAESPYLNLAAIYAGLGRRDQAVPVIERLLRRSPESVRAKQALRELESR